MLVKVFSGRLLHEARLRQDLSQDDLAYAIRERSRAKTTGRNIRRWELGTHAPHSGLIPAIADALAIVADELYETSPDSESASDEDEEDSEAMHRAAYHLDRAGEHVLADDLRSRARRAAMVVAQKRGMNA